jgi:hypothetical protein
MRIVNSILIMFVLLLAIVGFTQAAPSVSFNKPDTAVCQQTCWNPQISAVVAGLNPGQTVNLQLTYHIVNPTFLATDTVYRSKDNVGNGEYPITPQLFGVQCLWPGIPSKWVPPDTPDANKIVEIHFGANLLDPQTNNCITNPCTTGGQDYYWYTWVCPQGQVQIPEFPTMVLPITLVIGFLGAVMFIQRTREH